MAAGIAAGVGEKTGCGGHVAQVGEWMEAPHARQGVVMYIESVETSVSFMYAGCSRS